MTEWIVSNAWWFAPALTFAGVGMIVGALLWPRKATARAVPVDWPSEIEEGDILYPTRLMSAVGRYGRHGQVD